MNNDELNTFLAEEVMGWNKWDIIPNVWVWVNSKRKLMYFLPNDRNKFGETVWHPTTDIAQVMECAEKLDKEGMDYEIMSDRYSKEVRVWSPSKNLWFRKGWKSIADLPRNICLAFYEAMKGGE